VGDSICVEGFVTSVHNTSMEVFVKVVKEGLLTAEKTVCATAFLTFVALGENGKPDVVPRIYPESEMEKMLYEGTKLRSERKNKRREESRRMARLFGTEEF